MQKPNHPAAVNFMLHDFGYRGETCDSDSCRFAFKCDEQLRDDTLVTVFENGKLKKDNSLEEVRKNIKL